MYATSVDMIARFGAPEMVRLSRPADRVATEVDTVRIETALADASSLIDDYLRKLYALPLPTVPLSIVRATCVLARYDLAQGESATPSEESRLARKETIDWLKAVSTGAIELELPGLGGPAASASTGARVSDRVRHFDEEGLRQW